MATGSGDVDPALSLSTSSADGHVRLVDHLGAPGSLSLLRRNPRISRRDGERVHVRFSRLTTVASAATLTALTLTACASTSLPTAGTTPPVALTSTAAPAPATPAFTHKTTVDNVVAAAKAALTSLGTYAYGTYDKDIAAASKYLTATYSAHFNATATAQKSIALKLHSVSRISAVTVGIASLGEDFESATVLAGFTQLVTGTSTPHRRLSKVSAVVSMVEVNRKWLIGALAIPPLGPAAVGTYSLGSNELVDAMTAATTLVVTLGTLRRKHVASDYAKWLAGTTGALHTTLAKAQKSTAAAFTHAKADLLSICRAIGIVAVGTTTVEFLVYVSSIGSTTSNTLSELTVDKVDGHWLGAQIKTL
jgi:hypothetical protein